MDFLIVCVKVFDVFFMNIFKREVGSCIIIFLVVYFLMECFLVLNCLFRKKKLVKFFFIKLFKIFLLIILEMNFKNVWFILFFFYRLFVVL